MTLIDPKLLKRMWIDETPTGSGTAFTLSQVPIENDAVELYIDGLKLTYGTHYTLSGASITLTTALAAGQSIRASFIQKTGGS